jgi:4-hydroxybutyrate CoA-transferase
MGGISEYRDKITPAEHAVGLVRSGDRIYIHPGCGTPEPLIEALLLRAPELRDVEIVHMLTLGSAGYTRPEFEGHFRHAGFFLGGNVRQAIAERRADYIPISLSDIEYLFLSGEMPLDVVFAQASPPDEHGFVSLGVSIDCTLTAISCARDVVVEINERMPRTLGETTFHLSRASAIVETSRQVLEVPRVPGNAVQRRIAENVASLIPDGATLQMGIGGLPNSVWECLGGHKDLGIQSELCSDGALPLIMSGVVNGARKTLHPGKVIAGFVFGSQPLFDLIHENPIFEFHPTAYVNDPCVIGQNDRMIAINSALQVDLSGQICADSIGFVPYSGVGGQLDFLRGAGRSRGGKAIIALPSTAKHGTVSRIVPSLEPGAGVVTPRTDVHYVVTEHGIAYLRGKTLRQRAEALIGVADPRFQEELARACFYGRESRVEATV